jgi:hypothetical protein
MIRAHVLLCDYADVPPNNKLYISGAGISRVPVGFPTSLAILIYIPWDQTNTAMDYSLHLESADGSRQLHTASGEARNIEIGGQIEVGRPTGAPPGVPLEVPRAIRVPPLDLAPGRYMWRLTIAGETHDFWTASFALE